MSKADRERIKDLENANNSLRNEKLILIKRLAERDTTISHIRKLAGGNDNIVSYGGGGGGGYVVSNPKS